MIGIGVPNLDGIAIAYLTCEICAVLLVSFPVFVILIRWANVDAAKRKHRLTGLVMASLVFIAFYAARFWTAF